MSLLGASEKIMDKCFGIIYKAENRINGKVYIGQTVQPLIRRKQNHYFDMEHNRDNSILHKALKKYNKENFDWCVLEKCCSKEELNEMEFHYIKQYDSYKSGYNSTFGGEGAVGAIRSLEVRRKISNSMKGTKAYWYGRKHSAETKRKISIKISKILKGHKVSKETREKISKAHLGKKRSLDTRKNISKALIGKYRGKDSVCAKKFVVATPSGDKFVIEGLIDFCRTYENELLNYKNLSQCATGKRKHHKKYTCRYYNKEMDMNIPYWNGGKE